MEQYRLVGLVNFFGVVPDFLVPLFQKGPQQFFLQGEDGRITGFEPASREKLACSHVDVLWPDELASSGQKLIFAPGDKAVYAFQFDDGTVVCGGRDEVTFALRENLSRLSLDETLVSQLREFNPKYHLERYNAALVHQPILPLYDAPEHMVAKPSQHVHTDALKKAGANAAVLRAQENYIWAAQQYKRLLRMQHETGGDQYEIACTRGQVALCEQRMGNYSEALRYYAASLVGVECEYSMERGGFNENVVAYMAKRVTTATLQCFFNMAFCMQKLEQYASSIRFYTMLREYVFLERHPTVKKRDVLRNLADCYRGVVDATGLQDTLLELQETLQAEGGSAKELAQANRELVQVSRVLQNHQNTIETYELELEAQLRRHGAGNQRTVELMSKLADAYRLQERNTEALALYRRLLEAIETLYGPEHGMYLLCRQQMVELYRALGQQREMEEEILAIARLFPATAYSLYGSILSREDMQEALRPPGLRVVVNK